MLRSRRPASPTRAALLDSARRRRRRRRSTWSPGRPPTCSPISTALADAAALREETRGSHWREDFPERDDERWSRATSTSRMADGGTRARRSAPARRPTDARREPASVDRRDLLDELAAAGLDPRAVHGHDRRRARGGPARRRRDVTSAATIPADARGAADFAAREAGVVAGLGVAALVFHDGHGRRRSRSPTGSPDGTRVGAGDVVMRVAGPTRGLLTAERTALNFACHLSGVATATAALGRRARGHQRPGARHPQDAARAGARCRSTPCAAAAGSTTGSASPTWRWSRTTTWSPPGGVVPAYEAVRAAYPDLRVEVEVTDLDQLRELLDAGCERDPARQHGHRRRWPRRSAITAGRATLEASGGLTLERAREVAETGVDFISVGALTHSVQRLRPRPGPHARADDALLAADIGNSHTVLGLLDDGEVIARLAGRHRRAPHRRRVGGAAPRPARRDDVADGRRASRSARPCRRCCTSGATCWRGTSPTCRSVVVEPGVRTGVPVLMDNPREVGTDRIINALAAATEYGGPAIVVDFGGTATTFDVVSAQGQYVGGAIAPGHRDLARGARPARRPAAQGRAAPAALGDRQEHRRGAAVRHGLRRRQPGRGNRRPDDRRARRRPPTTCSVIATGYLAPLVVDECRCFTDHAPWLTLRGLELVFARNT